MPCSGCVSSVAHSNADWCPEHERLLNTRTTADLQGSADPAGTFFRPSCDTHDFLYSTFVPLSQMAELKARADATFFGQMLAQCRDAFADDVGVLGVCTAVATAFYDAVSLGGEQNFRNAQYAVSSCSCSCVPPAQATTVTGTFSNGIATVRWLPVPARDLIHRSSR